MSGHFRTLITVVEFNIASTFNFFNIFQEPLDLADPKLVQAIWKPEVMILLENRII